jgi:hypothetical protein
MAFLCSRRSPERWQGGSTLGPSESDAVQKLESRDSDGAVAMQPALAATGAGGVADAIEGGRSWLENGSAAMWGGCRANR